MLDHSITFTMRVFHAQRLKKSTCPLFLCVVLLLTLEEVVNKANALQMITQPNKTIVSFIGSNQTFSWNFLLTEEEKAKELKVTFGHWSKEYSMVLGDHLVTIVQDPIAKETVYKGNASIARRLNWVGDMARGFVAFQLTDVQARDSSDYGIRFRVDSFPPETEESGFTLSMQDPPSILTRTPEPQDITIQIVEGDVLNITCRTLMYGRSSVSWPKDNKVIENEDEKTLFLGNVSRWQAGEYICVSLSPYGNHSSPVTTVDVLYPPKIQTGDEQVLVELLRGHSIPLTCIAFGNPSPVLSWHRQRDGISETFKNTWNSSSLVVTPINDTDFTSYTCIATNKMGSDQVTFVLKEKADKPASESGTQDPGQTRMSGQGHSSLVMYMCVGAGIAVLAVSLVMAYVYWRKQRGNSKNCCTRSIERDGAERIPLGPQDEDTKTAESLQA